jgi:hypothetical protein
MKVPQEERSIFWKVIVSTILSKKCNCTCILFRTVSEIELFHCIVPKLLIRKRYYVVFLISVFILLSVPPYYVVLSPFTSFGLPCSWFLNFNPNFPQKLALIDRVHSNAQETKCKVKVKVWLRSIMHCLSAMSIIDHLLDTISLQVSA